MKSNETISWKQLSQKFDKGIHSAILHQYHAVQLIALAGKYLLPQQPDDSNTNMQYDAAGEWIHRGWKGGILKNSALLKVSDSGSQQKTVDNFFDSGIRILSDHYKSKPSGY